MGRSKLESIEGLERMWMPTVEEIFICRPVLTTGENKIINFKTLRKCCLFEITKFSFSSHPLTQDKNRALEGRFFSELASTNLKSLYLEYEQSDERQIEDIRWAAKLENSSLRELSKRTMNTGTENLERIQQTPTKKTVNRKFLNQVWFSEGFG